MTEPNTSPLAKADPQAIQLLFNKDPEELTTEDVSAIVEKLRADRAIFASQEEAKSLQPKKKVGTKAPPTNLSLEDLGFTV